jgi:peptidoglycan hydrolase-like protein with peptidoglycan-binding domain
VAIGPATPVPDAAAVSTVVKPARPAPAARPVLGLGSRGPSVRRAQSLLNRHGYRVPVTGYYGKLTARQVRRFQAAHGIRGTGQVGPLTYPELVRQEHAAGHGVGNHTWSHRRLEAEVDATSAVIGRATGAPVRCLRPPYATVDAASADRARARGLRLVLWDVDSNDWRRPGAAAIAGRVLGRVRSGDVVLLHDGGGNRTQTVAALDQVLASLSARGFRFSALCRD